MLHSFTLLASIVDAGAYAPIKPSDVPDGIDEIVTNEFMANNITYNSEPFVGCDTYNSTVLQACSQVR